jgi:hypothetical protein
MYYTHVPSSKRIKACEVNTPTYYTGIFSLDALECGGVGAQNFTLKLFLNRDFSHLIAHTVFLKDPPILTLCRFGYELHSLVVGYLRILLPSFPKTLELKVAGCSEKTVCTKLHSAFKTDTEVSPEMFVTI